MAAFECCGYLELTFSVRPRVSAGGRALIFGYDVEVEKEDLKELDKKRVDAQEDWSTSLHRIGCNIYYTGGVGR